MLVLTRRRNDKIVFPSIGVEIKILRVDGGRVRLGIEAPARVSIRRHEIAERIDKERVHDYSI